MYRKFTWRRDGQQWNQIQRVKRQHTENKHEEREHTHRKYTRVWRITKARREDNKTWNSRWNNGNIKRAERTWQVRDAPQELSDFQKEVLIFCRCFLRCSARQIASSDTIPTKVTFLLSFSFQFTATVCRCAASNLSASPRFMVLYLHTENSGGTKTV